MMDIMSILIMNRRCFFLIIFLLQFSTNGAAQNHSYTIIYEQVYPLAAKKEYTEAKKLFSELCSMYEVDPSERYQFSYTALRNGDVDFFKSEHEVIMLNYGYYFTYDDTMRIGGSLHDALKQYDLVDWLVEKTKLLYPKWVAENPQGFFIQQRVLQLSAANSTRGNLNAIYKLVESSGDSMMLAEALTYKRDLDFTHLYEIITLSRAHGLPNNFDHGYNTYYKLQQILSNNLTDKFNLERTWHHIFPHLEKAFFDGKISKTFLKIYDQALQKNYGYQYYGTIDDVEVLDPQGLSERRKKFGL